ncbi:hypothetical protein L5515_010486 [Caenorhabditis briggsae]|uniref:Uncharacterized protein n=2 Tax=Caenorhabditis briggsae TaxID=6238 RepID=A0AAE9ESR6_CAEBR|nr:hypothetical protein L5515_010486 [Caenorhabditis briggsae]
MSIMMNTKPVTYVSLKTVLCHTEPNLRFQISTRMPSIRQTEKRVPLKIETLALQEFKTTVNGTSYELGVYRDFHPDAVVADQMKRENENGGVKHDLDEYGFKVNPFSTPIFPGDMDFRNGQSPSFGDDLPEDLYRHELKMAEEALKKLEELEAKGITVEEYLQTAQEEVEGDVRQYIADGKEYVQRTIEHARATLYPYDCRKNDERPPYTPYIQLTVSKNWKQEIQRTSYDRKLYEAAKQVNHWFFANRGIIRVNQLNVLSHGEVCRLPIGLQICASIVTGYEWNMLPISSVLTPYCQTVRIRSIASLNCDSPVVRNAKILEISTENLMWPTTNLHQLPNPQIKLSYPYTDQITTANYFDRITEWLSIDRFIGSKLSIMLDTEDAGEKVLEMARSRSSERANCRSFKRCVRVRWQNGKDIRICYVKNKKRSQFEWILKTRIIKAEA